MARKALRAKQEKLENKLKKCNKNGEKMKSPTKHYNRCKNCGNPTSYMRDFGVCRICFRKFARQGKIMGVKKSSW